jgi:thiamine-monophosphate kinase
MSLGEFELIKRFFANAGPRCEDVTLGIGDDAALVRVPDGTELVVTVDTIVAGVHFPPGTGAEDIGYRALAVNLSDIAAMGAMPAWATLALTLPAADERWLEGFCAGFFSLARAHDVTLIGGDTTSGPLTITVQIMGHVPTGKALRRSGAHVGDSIFVSGHVGDAAAGLALIEKRADASDARHRDQLVACFLRPVPRIGLGRALRGLASAMIDISDGLGADLGHILEASGVGARIDSNRLPMSRALTDTFGPKRALELALGGGDDYELCFTLAREHEQLISGIETAAGCELSRIGVIESQPGLKLQDGSPVSQTLRGFDHFSR